jgi:hypothetical protein
VPVLSLQCERTDGLIEAFVLQECFSQSLAVLAIGSGLVKVYALCE